MYYDIMNIQSELFTRSVSSQIYVKILNDSIVYNVFK